MRQIFELAVIHQIQRIKYSLTANGSTNFFTTMITDLKYNRLIFKTNLTLVRILQPQTETLKTDHIVSTAKTVG
jgi:hypothetical protein